MVAAITAQPDLRTLAEKDAKLINQLTEKNQKTASHYHEQITTQLSLKGLSARSIVIVADHAVSALHDMVTEAKADLVMLVAHGNSGERRWPYGSIATSFIAHGSTPLMIMQDLSSDEIQLTHAELAVKEGRGH